MNVFVLCTGRCGSSSFIKACQHISNFTADHESRSGRVGTERFDYPENHIEADNRLSWYLGRLDEKYGGKARYVFLRRNFDEVARSYATRQESGIMHSFSNGLLLTDTMNEDSKDPLKLASDICHTMESNIRHFLKDKPHQMEVRLEHMVTDFEKFWDFIEAEGDLQAALDSFNRPTNTSEEFLKQTRRNRLTPLSSVPLRSCNKVIRIFKALPNFLARA